MEIAIQSCTDSGRRKKRERKNIIYLRFRHVTKKKEEKT